jgi:hypothetical protein
MPTLEDRTRGLLAREGASLTISMHAGQARAWKSERRFVFVLAGTQSGKTSWGPWWLEREIRRRGAGDYLAVTSSYDLFKLKMLPSLRETFEHLLRIGRYWSGDRILELKDPTTGKFWARTQTDPMWGRIILRSAESGGGLEATTANAAWLDEVGQDAFTLETWEAILRRLSLAQGRVLGTTTPYMVNWLKVEVYDRWVAGDPQFEVIQFHSSQNPAFPPEEQERAKATMPAWRYRMFYEGQFTRPAGMVYDCFDEEVHVVEPFGIPASWPRYVGVDFGGVNTALVWLAEDVRSRCYYLYEESLEGGQTTKEHARAALHKSRGTNLIGCWGGAKSEGQSRADWKVEGFTVREPPVWDLEAGIQRVYGLLKEKRLKIFHTCRGIRDEFGSYRRKLDPSGQPTDEIEAKRTFHRIDATRYVCAALNQPARPQPRVGGTRPQPQGGLIFR